MYCKYHIEHTFGALVRGALVREDENVLLSHLHVPLLLHLRVQHVPPETRMLIGGYNVTCPAIGAFIEGSHF